jgi:starch phosphorylase
MDGANVEIFERVGKDNIFIFGAGAQEIDRLGADNTYHPKDYFDRSEYIRDAVSSLVDGTLPGVGKDQFQDIYRSLLYGDYDRADKYYLLYDFDAYRAAFENVMAAYSDTPDWTRKAAVNTASAGYFSVDRTIEDYNRLIWGLDSI